MKFTLGFSPCPNDTFIFDAIANNKIDTKDFDFIQILGFDFYFLFYFSRQIEKLKLT